MVEVWVHDCDEMLLLSHSQKIDGLHLHPNVSFLLSNICIEYLLKYVYPQTILINWFSLTKYNQRVKEPASQQHMAMQTQTNNSINSKL